MYRNPDLLKPKFANTRDLDIAKPGEKNGEIGQTQDLQISVAEVLGKVWLITTTVQ
jgi:hypothetical protein